MGRRTILLIAALVVAGLGAVLVFLYAQNANDRAQADNDPVNVLVAKSDITSGTTGANAQSAGAFELKSVPSSAVAPGALSSVTPIENQIALTTIFTGQQILAQQFGATAASASSLPIPKGKIAVSIQLGDPARVAGFVVPGSEVAVFASVQAGDSNQVSLLLPKVQVIAAGPTTLVSAISTDESGNTNTEELPNALLTLAVTQDQAQKVIFASQEGQIYFGLLTDTSKVAPLGPTTTSNLFR